MVEGGMKCVKYLLFAFNLVFVIAGIGLIAAGAYVKVKLNEYYDFFGSDFMGPGILLIIVGVVIFGLAFFGCCGAIKENYCLTMTFAVCLAIIFILEIAGGIAGFVLKDDIESTVESKLKETLKQYNSTEGVRNAWDKLQEEFACCGANNSHDWTNEHLPVPKSCCISTNCDPTIDKYIYTKGCANEFEDWLKEKVGIIGGVGIGLAFVQVIGIIFACCLARAIRKEYEVV
uniref:Tetraspanin n=1 Tax=Arion vulgaris TaxID=1028688 RepID=A0A0B7B6P4_9EUPU